MQRVRPAPPADMRSNPPMARPMPPVMRPNPQPVVRYLPPPPPPPRRGMSDFEKALAIIGTVGVVAAIARNSPYSYYRYYNYPPRPVVVVERPLIVETPVLIEHQVVVEVEKPVYIETPVYIDNPNAVVQHIDPPVDFDLLLPMEPEDAFSPKMGALFRLEHMEIPGYSFTAARLSHDPLEGSPLYELGLQKGDVITRVGGTPVDALEVLEQHEKEVGIRYIKADTTRVMLANIYIPTDEELWGEEEPLLAP